MNAQQCPLCNGSGKLYDSGLPAQRNNIFSNWCHACKGDGYILVPGTNPGVAVPRIGKVGLRRWP